MDSYRISLYLFIFIHACQWTTETPSFPLENTWSRFHNFLVRLLLINIIISDLHQNFNFTTNPTLFNPTNLYPGKCHRQRWGVMWYFYNMFPFSFISPQHSCNWLFKRRKKKRPRNPNSIGGSDGTNKRRGNLRKHIELYRCSLQIFL